MIPNVAKCPLGGPVTTTLKNTAAEGVSVGRTEYNSVPQTVWLINNHLFLRVLEATKSESKPLADVVSDEGSLPGLWKF